MKRRMSGGDGEMECVYMLSKHEPHEKEAGVWTTPKTCSTATTNRFGSDDSTMYARLVTPRHW
jgi:hypothetical protein